MTQRRAPRLRTRLVLGNLLIILTALGVTWLVATLAGPPLFRSHLREGGVLSAAALDRAEQAFHVANLLQVLLASLIGFVLTVAASLLVTARLGRRVRELAALSAGVATGRFDLRLPRDHTSQELDRLATAFNDMAERLAGTERTRRRMLTDLAHELRTPIATVDGYLEGIEDGVETADPATIALLRGQLRRLTRLAEDINLVSAAEEHRIRIDPRTVEVATLLTDAVEAARPAYLAKGVELSAHPDVAAPVVVDVDRLGQALANVLANALRHTPAGGTVTVRTAAASRAAVAITIADTGEGIGAAELPYLFERFYRAHPSRSGDDRGSGIGLTISRAILTAHQGGIAVDSPGPGRGTTVTLTLPTAAGR